MSTATLVRPVLRTRRLLLRVFDDRDLGAIGAYYANPLWGRADRMLRGTAVSARTALVRRMARDAIAGPGDELVLAILDADHALVGELHVLSGVREPGVIEISVVLDGTHRYQGYAREAVAAALDLVLPATAALRARARIEPKDLRGQRLFAALGFTFVDHVRTAGCTPGDPCDQYFFEIDATRWHSLRLSGGGTA